MFVTVTVTPGSTPPEASETVPSMVPLAAVDCASAGAADTASDSRAEKKRRSMMEELLGMDVSGEYTDNRRGGCARAPVYRWKPNTSSAGSNSPEQWRSRMRLARYAPVT